MECLVQCTGAQVYRDVGLCPYSSAVLDELIGSESVAFQPSPHVVHQLRPLLGRTYPIFPMIGRSEVPAGPPEDGTLDSFHCVHNIFAKTPVIGLGRSFLHETPVDTTTQMLNKVAVNQITNISCLYSPYFCFSLHLISSFLAGPGVPIVLRTALSRKPLPLSPRGLWKYLELECRTILCALHLHPAPANGLAPVPCTLYDQFQEHAYPLPAAYTAMDRIALMLSAFLLALTET